MNFFLGGSLREGGVRVREIQKTAVSLEPRQRVGGALRGWVVVLVLGK